MLTRSQKTARAAYEAVVPRADNPADKKAYLSFARAFPTLIHTSGLAQATAFALAKRGAQGMVLDDLAAVLGIEPGPHPAAGAALQARARGEVGGLSAYLALSRESLAAATWIKRYAEALIGGEGTV